MEYRPDLLYDEATPSAAHEGGAGDVDAGQNADLARIRSTATNAHRAMFSADLATFLAIVWVGVFILIYRFHPWHGLGLGMATMLIFAGMATIVVESLLSPKPPRPDRHERREQSDPSAGFGTPTGPTAEPPPRNQVGPSRLKEVGRGSSPARTIGRGGSAASFACSRSDQKSLTLDGRSRGRGASRPAGSRRTAHSQDLGREVDPGLVADDADRQEPDAAARRTARRRPRSPCRRGRRRIVSATPPSRRRRGELVDREQPAGRRPDAGVGRDGQVDREPPSFEVDDLLGDDQVVAPERRDRAHRRTRPRRSSGSMAVEQDLGPALGRGAAHPGDRDRDDLAGELALDDRHRRPRGTSGRSESGEQVADLDRQGGDDPDVGRDRRRALAGVGVPNALVADRLDSSGRPHRQLIAI